jgi:hypothetical protein
MSHDALITSLNDQLAAARRDASIIGLLTVDHVARRSAPDHEQWPVTDARKFPATMAALRCLQIAKRANTLALALLIDHDGPQVDFTPFAGRFWPQVQERIDAIEAARLIKDERDVIWHLSKVRVDLAKALSGFDAADLRREQTNAREG